MFVRVKMHHSSYYYLLGDELVDKKFIHSIMCINKQKREKQPLKDRFSYTGINKLTMTNFNYYMQKHLGLEWSIAANLPSVPASISFRGTNDQRGRMGFR